MKRLLTLLFIFVIGSVIILGQNESSQRESKIVKIKKQEINPEVQNLVDQLNYYRKIGDIENANKISKELNKLTNTVNFKKENRRKSSPQSKRSNNNNGNREIDWTYNDVNIYFDFNTQINSDLAKHYTTSGNETNKMFVTFEQWDGTSDFNEIAITKSTNDGETWDLPLFITPTGSQPFKSPKIFQLNEDKLGLIYEKNYGSMDNDIYFARINNSDLTIDTTILTTSIFNNNRPSITTDFKDYPLFPYIYSTFHNYGNDSLMFHRGESMGENWTLEQKIAETNNPATPYSSIAYANDMIFVTYTFEGLATDNIGFVKSTDLGVSWSSPVIIDDFPYDFKWPDIAVVDDNTLIITYEEVDDTGVHDIVYAYSTDAGDTWNTVNYLANSADNETTPVIDGDDESDVFYLSFKNTDSNEIMVERLFTSDLENWEDLGNIKDASNGVNSEVPHSIVVKHNPLTGSHGAGISFPKYFSADGDYDVFFDASWIADFGDVNLDQAIDQNDIDYLLDYASWETNLDIQERRNADVSLNGWVSELDGAIIQKFVDGDIPSLPYDTSGGFPLAAMGNVDMPDVSGNSGETIEIPVNISGADNILSFGMDFEYDGSVLTFNQVNWNSSTSDFHSNVNQMGDSIYIAAESPDALNSDGELFTLEFTISGTPSTMGDTEVNMFQFIINEESLINDAASSTVTVVTDVSGTESEIPEEYSLNQNYPNPFNPSTKIKYGLPEQSNVSITIYNALGQKVTELYNGIQEAGFHQKLWNADNFGSGVYFVRMNAESLTSKKTIVSTKKMMLVK